MARKKQLEALNIWYIFPEEYKYMESVLKIKNGKVVWNATCDKEDCAVEYDTLFKMWNLLIASSEKTYRLVISMEKRQYQEIAKKMN